MRLSEQQRSIIRTSVAENFGAEAVVRLFGSRTDDNKRGGDIDLLIETARPLVLRIQDECRLAAQLYIKLGGRKVDVLVKDARSPMLPVYEPKR